MDIHFTEASSLASIDRQIEARDYNLAPAQYEIIRQVIYHTADFEYYSLLKFSEAALTLGFEALIAGVPIVVDVPEIQVSIVPRLQQTFFNPVYCCATTSIKFDETKTKAVSGLENLASSHSNAIFVIGQDQTALASLVDLIKAEVISPRLAIVTAPLFIAPNIKQYFQTASIPTIYIDSPKGGATVASAIVNSLVNLAWRANQN
ncbi:MAG: precorrin-8X methylmutase [Pleurocapsa sp. MO_226.B13]|nr:precorrin-8X methylmutase [Pleurocapsa sp. MO_226.B13]